ncbi:nitrate reductase molybdenum cofactor assembly chaperone NarJ [Microbulbifer aestuariivivens]|uniref:Nitrate reductase molybdenum cofactor assembly chaperone NarJ n=1 Tax=Microbulbifer aestuariivivens TaxID=1908308 RepID=A0ABP9WMM6_9GAMM
MKRILRAIALLLDYPSEELKTHISEVREDLNSDPSLSAKERAMLEPLLVSFERDTLLELQVTYSDVFDSSRTMSLNLFEHIHGDNSERGQAMLDLGEEYMQQGYYMQRNELPDYIPMFLEFVSCLPDADARDWLSQPAHVFAVLAQRLDEHKSAYAGLFHLLLKFAGIKPDAKAVQELIARHKKAEEKSIDEEWEEEPITFMATPPKTRTSGIVDRLKAAGKLISSSSDS